MGLESGKYFIFSVTHGAPVGRNPDVEDRSLLPFAVYMLPNSVQPPVVSTRSHPPTHLSIGHLCSPVLPPLGPRAVLLQWDVEKLPNGNYRLQTRDALIGALEGHVVVFLENGNLPLDTIEWSIVQRAGSDTDPDEGAFLYARGCSVPLPLVMAPVVRAELKYLVFFL